ncbi:alpha/beta hydrolase [Embleya sp. NBC_00896]|uniref:alpha/beta hydrolase n=1 Tax=Embleya sp. NBC_00896 TaxID=2975961 RepID=UPI00386CE102|nr:alpha/beta hydrolase-fold protein [Embleya sp. NBC_00896]
MGPPAARADTTMPASRPVLANAYGLTQLPTAPKPTVPDTAYDFVITVSTAEVAGTQLNDGGHHIRIVLPSDYYSNPTKRFPVLHLLNGSSADSDPATYFSAYPTINSSAGMIFVMPDGGPRGWYANWLNQNSAAGAQRWENFHINQVIPFIDANLRTTPDKQHRAVAGISMGGFGAVRYAERHPDLFSQVASFSGDLDLSRMSADLRLAVVASLTTYSPQVGSDDLFGTPYPFSVNYPYSDVLWNDASPGAHADALRGMGVSIYVGNGGGGAIPPVPGVNDPYNLALEWWLPGAANHFKAALDAAGVPSYFVNYGDGTGTPWADCRGGHNYLCWKQDLADYIPRLQQAFGIS